MLNIENLFLFQGLSDVEINSIIAEFPKPVTFSKNDIIYSNNNFTRALGIIVDGVAFAVSNNQNKIHLKTFSSGMCFGAAALFGEKDGYVSTVIAKTDAKILFITENMLKNLFERYPRTAVNYITFLSDKIRFLNKKLSVISCSAAEDTLLKYLNTAADSSGYVQLPSSMTLLAKTLGFSRATLYRVLETLENNGRILRENNKIKVIKL